MYSCLVNREHCGNFLSDEKRQKEDPDQDGSSERSVDEWLSRREKKLAALTSGRYLWQDTAQNGDLGRLECFQYVSCSLWMAQFSITLTLMLTNEHFSLSHGGHNSHSAMKEFAYVGGFVHRLLNKTIFA